MRCRSFQGESEEEKELILKPIFAAECSSRPMCGQEASTCKTSRWSSITICLRESIAMRARCAKGYELTFECYIAPRNRENYIHRIGRSGRFGRKGVAINVSPIIQSRSVALLTG